MSEQVSLETRSTVFVNQWSLILCSDRVVGLVFHWKSSGAQTTTNLKGSFTKDDCGHKTLEHRVPEELKRAVRIFLRSLCVKISTIFEFRGS